MGSQRRVATALATAAGVALVIAAWAVLQLWGLGSAAFHTKAEPREGLVVLEIVRNGDWLLPRRNGLELPAKPPLFHWLGAVASRLHGAPDEWSIRLPSAVLSGIAALAVFATGTVVWGIGSAVLAALALLTSFEWLRAATSARVDMTLTFGLTLAFCGLLLVRAQHHAAWLFLVYTGIAWAVLAKGPVGIALPLLQVGVITAVDRNFDYVRRLRLGRGLIVVLLVASAWYAAALIEGRGEFFQKQILNENVYRFFGTQHFKAGHRHSVGYLLLAMLGGLAPWTIFLPSVGTALWADRARLRGDDPRVFAALWIAVVFAFYALATSKRGVYLLALYPAVMLLVGWWWHAVLRGRTQPRRLRLPLATLSWGTALILGVGALGAAAQTAGVPLFASVVGYAQAQESERQLAAALAEHAAALAALLVAGAVAAVIVACGAHATRWGIVYVGIFMLIASATVLARQVVLPVFGREVSRARFFNALLRVVPDRTQVGSYRHFDYGLAFYWGGNLPVVRPPLSASGPRYVIMAEREWLRLGADARQLYERIPGLRSGRAGNLGEMVLLQRLGADDEPTPPASTDRPPAAPAGSGS